jgi:hypothetical protein
MAEGMARAAAAVGTIGGRRLLSVYLAAEGVYGQGPRASVDEIARRVLHANGIDAPADESQLRRWIKQNKARHITSRHVPPRQRSPPAWMRAHRTCRFD